MHLSVTYRLPEACEPEAILNLKYESHDSQCNKKYSEHGRAP